MRRYKTHSEKTRTILAKVQVTLATGTIIIQILIALHLFGVL